MYLKHAFVGRKKGICGLDCSCNLSPNGEPYYKDDGVLSALHVRSHQRDHYLTKVLSSHACLFGYTGHMAKIPRMSDTAACLA